MSVGQRGVGEEEELDSGPVELYTTLGSFDTPELFGEPYKVDTSHDIPYGGANSVDRKTIYIDRVLYQEVMDGTYKKTGLLPRQIIDLWIIHEHTEIVLSAGNNIVNSYYPAHTRALCMEHEALLAILGTSNREAKVRLYEETIWPGLVKCYHRDIKRPPKDLWCEPLLDDPEPRDEEILEALSKLGVSDARKRGKYEVHYQPGPRYCKDCRYWNPKALMQEHGKLAACKIVAGTVRDVMHCDYFKPATPPHPDAKKAKDGKWYLPDAKRPGKYLRVEKGQ